MYGPDDRKGTLVDECINVFSEDGSLRLGACEQKWNYLYISDFTDLIFEMIQKGCKSGIYNVGGEETEILKKFVLTIKQLCGNKGEVSFDGKASNPEGSPNLMPNIGRIKAEVGWQPRVTFELGIEEILRRKKENEVICS